MKRTNTPGMNPMKGTDQTAVPPASEGPTRATVAARAPKFIPTDVKYKPKKGGL